MRSTGPNTGVSQVLPPSITLTINDPSGLAHAAISAKKIAICNQPLAVIGRVSSELLGPQQGDQQVNANRYRYHSGDQIFHCYCPQSLSQASVKYHATTKKATIIRQ